MGKNLVNFSDRSCVLSNKGQAQGRKFFRNAGRGVAHLFQLFRNAGKGVVIHTSYFRHQIIRIPDQRILTVKLTVTLTV
jgi:hypothetical protein